MQEREVSHVNSNIPPVGRLRLKITDANLTKTTANDFLFNKLDPYVQFDYNGQTFKTDVSRNSGSKPVWNNDFTLDTRGNEEVDFVMYDRDRLSADDFIAQSHLSVNDIVQKRINSPHIANLNNCGNTVGTLTICFEYNPYTIDKPKPNPTPTPGGNPSGPQPSPQNPQRSPWDEPRDNWQNRDCDQPGKWGSIPYNHQQRQRSPQGGGQWQNPSNPQPSGPGWQQQPPSNQWGSGQPTQLPPGFGNPQQGPQWGNQPNNWGQR